mmetsp:Transcript_129630/g.276496  ORF Transcript_129630/g.276496 Transcript_129630/m.276496 type:complete len:142 (+) Transcript_129630:107-532(+)
MVAPAIARLLVVMFVASMPSTVAEANTCEGGSEAACGCLLSCKVFGGDDSLCHESKDPNTAVDRAVEAALKKSGTECDGITCVVQCAKQLGCLDDAVKGRCMNVKADRPGCEVKCDGSGASRGAISMVALLGAVAALSAMW